MTFQQRTVIIPNHLTKAWLKSITDDELWQVYNHFVAVDDHLSFDDSAYIGPKLRRVRDQMERRGLL